MCMVAVPITTCMVAVHMRKPQARVRKVCLTLSESLMQAGFCDSTERKASSPQRGQRLWRPQPMPQPPPAWSPRPAWRCFCAGTPPAAALQVQALQPLPFQQPVHRLLLRSSQRSPERPCCMRCTEPPGAPAVRGCSAPPWPVAASCASRSARRWRSPATGSGSAGSIGAGHVRSA